MYMFRYIFYKVYYDMEVKIRRYQRKCKWFMWEVWLRLIRKLKIYQDQKSCYLVERKKLFLKCEMFEIKM